MSLATLALAVLAPAVSPAQLPTGPLLGPNGGPLSIIDVELSGSAHWLLATEHVSFEDRPVVASIDAAGTITWTPPLPPELMPSGTQAARLLAVGENRILAKDLTRTYRTFALTPSGWVQELALTPSMHGGTFRDVFGDISGSTVALHMPVFFASPKVVDAASPNVTASLATPPDAGVRQLALNDRTAVTVELETATLPSGEYVTGQIRLPVFRRIGLDWVRVGEIEDPNGFGWRALPTIALEGNTLAVSLEKVSPSDPCPKLYLFEEDSSGAFVLEAEFEAASPCAMSSVVGVGYRGIQLLGTELAAIEGLDHRADRFERTASGWVRRERVAGEGWIAAAWPVHGKLVGTEYRFGSASSTEVFEPMDSPGTTAIACAPSVPFFSRLETTDRTQTTVGPTSLSWTVQAAAPGTPYFFAVGFQPGSRTLGPAAELCIGGAVSVVPPTQVGDYFGRDFAFLVLDPVAAGLLPGGTIYVQAWRPQPSVPGGLASNSLSILFAP